MVISMISPSGMLQQEFEIFYHSSRGTKPKQLAQEYFL